MWVVVARRVGEDVRVDQGPFMEEVIVVQLVGYQHKIELEHLTRPRGRNCHGSERSSSPPTSELIEPQTDLLVWGSGAVDYKSPMWICFSSRRCHEWGEKPGGSW